MSEKPAIDFIGLGIVGLPMASNLLAAGYAVCGLNRSPVRPALLIERGGRRRVRGGVERGALLGGFAQSRILEVTAIECSTQHTHRVSRPGCTRKISTSSSQRNRLPVRLPAAELLRELAARSPEVDHSALRTLLD